MKFVFIMESYIYATLMYYFSFFLWYFVTFSGELVLDFLYSYIFFYDGTSPENSDILNIKSR